MEDTFRPWLEIWTRPRSTIRRIIQENPNRSLWVLAFIYGLGSLLNNAQSLSLGLQFNLFTISLIAAIFAPIWGYIFFSLWSFVVYLVGKMFKGAGSFQQIRAAYAWSCVPFIINIGLWILLAALFGQNLFISGMANVAIPNTLIFVLFFALTTRLVLAVWSLVIYFNALAEVQTYSLLKAILNVVIAGFLLALVVWTLWTIYPK